MLSIHFDRLADIVHSELDHIHNDEKVTSEASPEKGIFLGDLEVLNVGFKYGDCEKEVFKNLSLKINHGESVAIIGQSGAGKSTLLKCMIGLFKVTNGDILVDGNSIYKDENYRSQIAVVMQDDQLLSGTILENICCFSDNPDFELAKQCAVFACIDHEIMNMPMQYNTLVGDMGSSLSGGQKQRLILARALYRKPKILFLDEATSHLDTKNEEQLNSNIKQLNITKIMIAHRPETIKSADRVVGIGRGKIVELTQKLNKGRIRPNSSVNSA